MLACRHDLAAVIARLDLRPVDELLPFIEEIPARRGGEVVWRLPRELALLRRRPLRFEAFVALLDELGNTLHRAALERRAELREALQESLVRAARDAADPAVYLPASLRALEEKLADWLAAPGPELREKRRRLDAWLLDLLATRHALARPAPATESAEMVRRARELAAEAIREDLLRPPCLAPPLLHLLLLAELARPPGDPDCRRTLAASLEEAAGGLFDPSETARRLRALEKHGTFVSTLIFALLRLHETPRESA